jgi:paraquat-inducible protein B
MPTPNAESQASRSNSILWVIPIVVLVLIGGWYLIQSRQ